MHSSVNTCGMLAMIGPVLKCCQERQGRQSALLVFSLKGGAGCCFENSCLLLGWPKSPLCYFCTTALVRCL